MHHNVALSLSCVCVCVSVKLQHRQSEEDRSYVPVFEIKTLQF